MASPMSKSPMSKRGTLVINKSNEDHPEAKKLQVSKSDRNPTLPEKISIVNRWFASCIKGNGKSFKQAEVKIEVIAELLVSKMLVSDTDTGIKHVMKSLLIRE